MELYRTVLFSSQYKGSVSCVLQRYNNLILKCLQSTYGTSTKQLIMNLGIARI